MSSTPPEPVEAAVAAPVTGPPALVREVESPSRDHGRATGLAMVCSAAGVALGFALAGSLFAAMSPPPRFVHTSTGGGCPGRYHPPMVAVSSPSPIAWLGVQVTDPAGPPTLARIYRGSPAEQAGLREGDLVVRLDGVRLGRGRDVVAGITAHQPGDIVQLEVQRAGQVEGFTIRLGAIPGPRR